jgi:hypothetical protein
VLRCCCRRCAVSTLSHARGTGALLLLLLCTASPEVLGQDEPLKKHVLLHACAGENTLGKL